MTDETAPNGESNAEKIQAINADAVRMAAQFHVAVCQLGWSLLALGNFGVNVSLPEHVTQNPALSAAAQPHFRALESAMAMIQSIAKAGRPASNILVV